MSGIDWSKAPEGTTGAMVANFKGATVTHGSVEFIGHPKAFAREVYHEDADSWVYHERPIPWIGEGLPPVGAEFERRFIDHDDDCSSWAWGRVLAHGQRRIFYVDRTGDEWSHAPADMEFRPIRTPEQIAAEEREHAISQMADDAGHFTGSIDDLLEGPFAALYDAGYRKVQP